MALPAHLAHLDGLLDQLVEELVLRELEQTQNETPRGSDELRGALDLPVSTVGGYQPPPTQEQKEKQPG